MYFLIAGFDVCPTIFPDLSVGNLQAFICWRFVQILLAVELCWMCIYRCRALGVCSWIICAGLRVFLGAVRYGLPDSPRDRCRLLWIAEDAGCAVQYRA